MNRRLVGSATAFTAAAALANLAPTVPVEDRAREAIAARFAGCTVAEVVDTGRVLPANNPIEGPERSVVTVMLDPHVPSRTRWYEKMYDKDDTVMWRPYSVSARMIRYDENGEAYLGNDVQLGDRYGEMGIPRPGGKSKAVLLPRAAHPQGDQIALFANTKVYTLNNEGLTTSTASAYCGAIVLGSEKPAWEPSVFIAKAPQEGWQKMANPPQFAGEALVTQFEPREPSTP